MYQNCSAITDTVGNVGSAVYSCLRTTSVSLIQTGWAAITKFAPMITRYVLYVIHSPTHAVVFTAAWIQDGHNGPHVGRDVQTPPVFPFLHCNEGKA